MNLYNFKYWYLFTIIALLYILLGYVANTFIYTDNFYYSILSSKFEPDRIPEIIAKQHKFQYVGYILLPIFLLFKMWLISGIIFIGFYFFNKDIKYRVCLKIVLIAELISIVGMFIKVSCLLIIHSNNQNDIQYFSPLSITQLLDIDKLPKYLFYPLQLFNVFEIAYWLVLAYGIMAFTGWKFSKSLKAVASSYGVALAVWVVIVVFIQVQFS